jgi:hypothetical protein
MEEAHQATGISSQSVSLEEVHASVIQAPREWRATREGGSLSGKRRSARLKRRAVRSKNSIEGTTEKAIDFLEIG